MRWQSPHRPHCRQFLGPPRPRRLPVGGRRRPCLWRQLPHLAAQQERLLIDGHSPSPGPMLQDGLVSAASTSGGRESLRSSCITHGCSLAAKTPDPSLTPLVCHFYEFSFTPASLAMFTHTCTCGVPRKNQTKEGPSSRQLSQTLSSPRSGSV